MWGRAPDAQLLDAQLLDAQLLDAQLLDAQLGGAQAIGAGLFGSRLRAAGPGLALAARQAPLEQACARMAQSGASSVR